MIREKPEQKKDGAESSSQQPKKIGKAKGIRFDRGGQGCEIFSNDEELILNWRNKLRGKINQRGFHELF